MAVQSDGLKEGNGMTETEAIEIVDSWDLSESDYDLNGCIEDLMNGMSVQSKSEILLRNEWMD